MGVQSIDLSNEPDAIALWPRAERLFPTNPNMQRKWINAVLYLRRHSSIGYALDKSVTRTPAPPLLHGYQAPTVPITTHVALPDEQIVPPEAGKVHTGPWRRK